MRELGSLWIWQGTDVFVEKKHHEIGGARIGRRAVPIVAGVFLSIPPSATDLLAQLGTTGASPTAKAEAATAVDPLGQNSSWRSHVKLRTIDQNLLNVPNRALAQMQFENMKDHPKLQIDQNFLLRIATPVERLRSVLDRVKRMLDEHPSVESGSRIRLNDFAGSAFEAELFAYVKTGDWVEFTAIRHGVLLKVGSNRRRVRSTNSGPHVPNVPLQRNGAKAKGIGVS